MILNYCTGSSLKLNLMEPSVATPLTFERRLVLVHPGVRRDGAEPLAQELPADVGEGLLRSAHVELADLEGLHQKLGRLLEVLHGNLGV